MKIKLFIISAIIFTVISCSKDKTILKEPVVESNNSMLKFKTVEEFDAAVSEVVQFSESELKAYEEERGYTSFGRASEEFYRNINIESFQSTEDIVAFVDKNSHYLQLVEDGNGEYELETKFYSRSDRYILNKDKMYQVGDNLYKIFEEGYVSVNVKDVDINEIKTKDTDYFKNHDKYNFISSVPGDISFKSRSSNCGTKHTWRKDNKKDRTKVVIEVTRPLQTVKCHFLARPYKKTFGVWYHCGRTMMADVKINFGYTYLIDIHSGWEIRDSNLNYYRGWQGTSKFEWTDEKFGNHGDQWHNDGQWINSYDVYVDSYSTSSINEYCWTNP